MSALRKVLFLFVFSVTCRRHGLKTELIRFPFHIGPVSCRQICYAIGGCRVYGYETEQLECKLELLASGSKTVSKNSWCGAKGCRALHKCIHTRTGPPLCVPLSLKSVFRAKSDDIQGTNRKQGNKLDMSTDRAPAERVLVLTSNVVSSGTYSYVGTFDVTTGKVKSLLRIFGTIVTLAIAGDALYRCQEEPKGLFMTTFTGGKLQLNTERKLVNGPCSSLAVDSEKKKLFFIATLLVVGNLRIPLTFGMMRVGRMHSNSVIVADTHYHVLYLFRRGGKSIKRYTYTGHLQHTINAGYSIRDLVLLSEAQMLYYTHMGRMNELMSADMTPNRNVHTPKAKKTLFLGPITAFGVTNQLVVLVSNSTKYFTYKTYLTSALQEPPRRSGQFHFKEPNIKLFCDAV